MYRGEVGSIYDFLGNDCNVKKVKNSIEAQRRVQALSSTIQASI
jgi:hypothetical protein